MSKTTHTGESFEIDNDFLEKSRAVIEYIDTDESDTIVLKNSINDVDNGERYSHCEIHSSLIMGFVGFTIPFVNTSQARKMYMELDKQNRVLVCMYQITKIGLIHQHMFFFILSVRLSEHV